MDEMLPELDSLRVLPAEDLRSIQLHYLLQCNYNNIPMLSARLRFHYFFLIEDSHLIQIRGEVGRRATSHIPSYC